MCCARPPGIRFRPSHPCPPVVPVLLSKLRIEHGRRSRSRSPPRKSDDRKSDKGGSLDRKGDDRKSDDRKDDRKSDDRRKSDERKGDDRNGGGGGGGGNRLKGEAARWNPRGFGFIKPTDGSEDLFCHVSGIADGNVLREGDMVEYTPEYDDRKGKYRAVNVTGGRTESDGGRDDRGGGGGYGGGGRGGGGGSCEEPPPLIPLFLSLPT